MPKTKSDPDIGKRAAEIVAKAAYEKEWSISRMLLKLGIPKARFFGWQNGIAPDAKYLQILAINGADIKYILIGKKTCV